MRRRAEGGRWTRRGLAIVASGVVSLAFVAPAIGSSGSEFACEEAAAHLQDCCPGFDPRTVQCDYTIGCGGSEPNEPEIGQSESDCITRLDCAALKSHGICASLTAGQGVRCP